ncbi:glycoside hydrolase family 16 protein [Streptomyces stackebrandtii]|uniref:glycoside hydrolase family 16 protein n=1 Tax=Streptomyces stackebrandtii TaxID=3051177 RepID=UPI0028DB2016|nr:glycoside hydrolase family 16 protein [Streptomyces sp. DSM 40976]
MTRHATPRSRRRRAALTLASALLALTACAGPADTATPPATARPAAVSDPPSPGPWRLVLEDGFDGTELDSALWATCYDWNKGGCTISSNDESEWYLPSQVSVRDGELTLTAQRRATRGSDDKTYPWRSGMISTGRDQWYGEPRRTFTYGYFEASIRIPSEEGMFPAFWMMPASRFTPPEVDIMEFIASTTQVNMYVHWREPDGERARQRGTYGPADFAERFHVYGLLWQPDALVWYVDGIERFRVSDPEHIPDVPMEVLLNLAVGVPEEPPDTVDTARMRVDWVRVWQQ